jgi:hypothetical protein
MQYFPASSSQINDLKMIISLEASNDYSRGKTTAE